MPFLSISYGFTDSFALRTQDRALSKKTKLDRPIDPPPFPTFLSAFLSFLLLSFLSGWFPFPSTADIDRKYTLEGLVYGWDRFGVNGWARLKDFRI